MKNLIIMLLGITNVILLFLMFKNTEDKDMAAMYALLIIKSRKTFSQVPATLKEQVREILIDMECEYLINE